MICRIAIAMLFFLPSAASGADSFAMKGWREPRAAELGSLADQKWRDDNAKHYLSLTGDFDGDGKPDEARLMVRDDGKAFALFVKLGGKDGALKLDEFSD